jgi:hypothetical protein
VAVGDQLRTATGELPLASAFSKTSKSRSRCSKECPALSYIYLYPRTGCQQEVRPLALLLNTEVSMLRRKYRW